MTRPKDPAHALSTPSATEIRVERVFDAPRERVWRAMTEPELVAQWWGRGNGLTIERMEVEPGGRWRFVEHAPEGDFGFEGRYLEVAPPERLVETFGWDDMPGGEVVNAMTLEDLGDGRTRLVTVSRFRDRDERDAMLAHGMEAGLAESYRALDELLSRPA